MIRYKIVETEHETIEKCGKIKVWKKYNVMKSDSRASILVMIDFMITIPGAVLGVLMYKLVRVSGGNEIASIIIASIIFLLALLLVYRETEWYTDKEFYNKKSAERYIKERERLGE